MAISVKTKRISKESIIMQAKLLIEEYKVLRRSASSWRLLKILKILVPLITLKAVTFKGIQKLSRPKKERMTNVKSNLF